MRRPDLLARAEHVGDRFGFARGYDASLLSAIFETMAGFGQDAHHRVPGAFEENVARLLKRREGKLPARLTVVAT